VVDRRKNKAYADAQRTVSQCVRERAELVMVGGPKNLGEKKPGFRRVRVRSWGSSGRIRIDPGLDRYDIHNRTPSHLAKV
jgi:hypothetical protein